MEDRQEVRKQWCLRMEIKMARRQLIALCLFHSQKFGLLALIKRREDRNVDINKKLVFRIAKAWSFNLAL